MNPDDRYHPQGPPVATTSQMKPLTKMIKFRLKPPKQQTVRIKRKKWTREIPYY